MAPTSRRTHDPSRRPAAEATAQRRRASLRKKRIVAIIIAGALVLSTVAGVIAASTSTTTDSTAPTSTTLPTTTEVPATGIEPTGAPRGEALTGATPCPPVDGSAVRTTSFAEPPPMCIDPTRFHTAVVTTDAGALTFQLNPQRAPESVNAFVVLARYGFYDDAPITAIAPRGWFEAGGLLAGDGPPAGFTIPDEAPPQGQIFTPGTIAMVGDAGTAGPNRGAFLVATFENAPAIDQGVSSFGILLDGTATLAAIDAAATADGRPARPITIESVTVTESDPIP
ncbi:peptidylprolyl isomerase [Rhabdothermincola salaria]|uniref:peptidylprolyl isomerase n=1 Tax=Rhabdothermincola salaria TaxID=2903142 RepID=UPI001E6544D7|nr:peptidylprolyl isomerase [Rhabdothermincola salaria]MCD9625404.1 peptidylprolyl isomerase [Rhabdothermincola salaria]